MTEYRRKVPITEPEGDADGRNALYAYKFHTLLSIMYYKDKRFRQMSVFSNFKPSSLLLTLLYIAP